MAGVHVPKGVCIPDSPQNGKGHEQSRQAGLQDTSGRLLLGEPVRSKAPAQFSDVSTAMEEDAEREVRGFPWSPRNTLLETTDCLGLRKKKKKDLRGIILKM